ncbi:DUF447 domain-containing protein [Roseimaritima ulvae]|uniref:DUF447 domain-containing protein n=1 Tax=Roseimaritima ulvae TaxID=980254 RepID=UPI00138FEC27|nr:DUF447 domain-containing protein [Roseimaritima ulvae]
MTTTDAQGAVNIAPMGPVVDRAITSIELRPFVGSRTYANLRATNRAVVHVTDDCLLLARAAIGSVDSAGLVEPIRDGQFSVLRDACRWYAVEITAWHEHPQRPRAECVIVQQQRNRDFFGLNRAQYAVVEAAILATRIHLIAPEVLQSQLRELATLVERAGGDQERQAFELLEKHIAIAHGKIHH